MYLIKNMIFSHFFTKQFRGCSLEAYNIYLDTSLFENYVSHCIFAAYNMSQRMTKHIIWSLWPAKTQISLCISPVWQGFLSILLWIDWRMWKAHAISEDSDQTARMRRLIWVFAGRTSLIVGFTVAQLDARPTGDQEVAVRPPPGWQHSFVEIWSWNLFCSHSLSSADSRRAVVNSGERIYTILLTAWRTKPAQ